LESVLALIAEMVDEAGSIEGINASIAEIASRTNLLGMNAAIEAGDAGRGFAVVAGEIRSLSERTANGAKDSERELKGLAGLIERIVSAGQEASSRLERIFEAIEETGRLHDEIGQALQEQDISNREVLEALSRMNDVARSVANASAAMREDSGNALERMRSLLDLSRGIETSMTAGSLELERISTTIAAFADAAQGNAERIRAVEAEMSRFKTA